MSTIIKLIKGSYGLLWLRRYSRNRVLDPFNRKKSERPCHQVIICEVILRRIEKVTKTKKKPSCRQWNSLFRQRSLVIFYSTDVNKYKSMLLARGLALCESLCGYSISGKLLKQYTFHLTFTKVFLQFKLTPISLPLEWVTNIACLVPRKPG